MTYILGDSALGLPNAGSGLVYITSSTFSAVSSVSIDNCFSSSHTNYRIMLSLTGGGTGTVALNLRWRAASTDATGANYNYANAFAYPTVSGGGEGAATDTTLSMMTVRLEEASTYTLDVYNPAVAARTFLSGQGALAHNTAVWVSRAIAGNHTLSTAYDGFTLYPASSTITGTYWIYGYRTS